MLELDASGRVWVLHNEFNEKRKSEWFCSAGIVGIDASADPYLPQ